MIQLIFSKLFTLIYNWFLRNVLIYPFTFEDCRIDRKLFNYRNKNVLTLTSAGDNVLDILTEDANIVVSIDQNIPQTSLLELKISAFKELDYDTFYKCFSGNNGNLFRNVYHSKLKKNLSPNAVNYWNSWYSQLSLNSILCFFEHIRGQTNYIKRAISIFFN